MSIQPSGEAPAVPVCPRHPDRESYVRCQRCERPVCPECQRPAAVGIQCVDCVRDQNRTVRSARTIFGGTVAGASPRVTQGIVAICVVLFLLQLAGTDVTQRFAYAPVLTLAEPWRMITSAFLHSPSLILHILFNMYALWLTGPYLETLLGRARFIALYLISAFGGSVFYLLLANPNDEREWFGGAVGASGAVFGLFAALLVVNRRLGRESGAIVAVIAINAVLGFVVPNVAWEAHVGGLISGLAAAAVLAYAPKSRRTAFQVAGLSAVMAGLVLLVALKVMAVGTAAFV